MAKHKLLAGLVLGGAAFAAYHALDLEQREALKDTVRDKGNALKDRAVDYAFYAADALDDFKEGLNDRQAAKTDDVSTDETVTDDAPEDDIVLSSDDVAELHKTVEQHASAVDDDTDQADSTDSTESTTSTKDQAE